MKDYFLIKSSGNYVSFVTTSDDDALDEQYNNVYTAKYLCKVKKLFEIRAEILGENLNTDSPCCCKEKPEWYMLYTDWTDEESPVVCGRCGKTVSLYKLPHISGENEHYGVLGWKKAYRDMDSLWVYCLSDRFTYRQMNSTDSQLSKIGRDICKEFEKATGVPFFYYLFHSDGRSGKKKTPDSCPSCGASWALTGEKTFIDYKCDKCRLVADEV